MKKLLPLLLLILIGCSEPEPLNYQLLVERDGIHYRIDNNKIYSGPVFTFDNQNKILSEMILKDGVINEIKYNYSNGAVAILIKINDNIKTYYFFNVDGSENPPINIEMLNERNDIYYTKDTNQLYYGPVFSLYENGQLEEEETYKNGQRDGPYKLYHKNGQLKEEGLFKNGQRYGPFKSYHDNGQLMEEGTFKYSKLDGPWKYYNDNGQLLVEATFNNGKMISEKQFSYHDNGQLLFETTYKDDKPDGPYKKYHDNGQLSQEGTYNNGQRYGPFKSYYDNGQLKKEGTYKYNKLDGPFKSYHQNGQLYSEGTYKNGKLIDSKFY